MVHSQVFAAEPSIEVHVEHILLQGCGIATDADQQPLLRRLRDDRVQRSGAP
jgi:hypothetical protein